MKLKAQGDFEFYEIEGAELSSREFNQNKTDLNMWGIKPLGRHDKNLPIIQLTKRELFSRIRKSG